ncbi:CoA transferase [Streptomyces sp. NRRL S-1824]|uniref:CoA transferase n=1 Tax=Streptomyces sp. NRRL S-1824 TaxID=1463889 RepID=UPI00068A0D81|nr:CoA transferase [Streptomyces sp. NRRL S-1824]
MADAAPGVHRCSDGRHLALGAIEPQFYAQLLRVLGLAGDPDFARQQDRDAWPVMRTRLTEIFAGRTRDAWAASFEGIGACVTPVLSLGEAAEHPHNTVRGTYRRGPHGGHEPAPAPRFGATPAGTPDAAPVIGADTTEVLSGAGFDDRFIEALREKGIIG